MHAHPHPLIFVNNLWGLVRRSLELLQIRVRKQTRLQSASAVRTPHICDNDTLPPTRPGQLNSRAITCRPTWLNGG